MKKILYSMLALAMAAFTLTSCEDVPAPYDDPNGNTPDGPVVIDPSGDGTQANPYNVAATIEEASKLGSGEESANMVYIKGIVTSISENYDGGYGNATYYISDDNDGTNKFYVYRSKYLGNTSYSSGDLLKVGDEVVVCGKLTNYNGTLETVQNGSYLYSLNGKTVEGGGGTDEGVATGDGTLENPFNAVAANKYASSLAADEVSDKDIYIKGKIASIKENFSTQYGNASFYISDDGTSSNTFYVFRTYYLGNVKYTEGTLPQVGDDVIICGKVTNYYGNTPETAQNQSYIYSLTSNGGGGDNPDVPENSITLKPVDLGLDNGTEVGTQKLSDGTVLTFDSGGNNNAPKYYNSGTNIRMYPKNSLTIKSSKKIAYVIINCDTYQNVICNASGDVASTPGTVDVKDAVITINGIDADQVVISNTSSQTGTASQIRITSLTIVYAD